MATFYASATDECGDYVSLELDAESKTEAWREFEEQYPDCRIIQVMNQAEIQARENVRYQRLSREMDQEDY